MQAALKRIYNPFERLDLAFSTMMKSASQFSGEVTMKISSYKPNDLKDNLIKRLCQGEIELRKAFGPSYKYLIFS